MLSVISQDAVERQRISGKAMVETARRRRFPCMVCSTVSAANLGRLRRWRSDRAANTSWSPPEKFSAARPAVHRIRASSSDEGRVVHMTIFTIATATPPK